MRPNPLRERWARGEAASCLWIDIGWPVSVEGLVKLPYDSFTLDLQHSLIDRGTAVNVLQSLSLGTGVPLVRVTQNDPAEIGFVLDAGAYGVICQQIETAEECARFVSACRYRSTGTTRLHRGPSARARGWDAFFLLSQIRRVACGRTCATDPGGNPRVQHARRSGSPT